MSSGQCARVRYNNRRRYRQHQNEIASRTRTNSEKSRVTVRFLYTRYRDVGVRHAQVVGETTRRKTFGNRVARCVRALCILNAICTERCNRMVVNLHLYVETYSVSETFDSRFLYFSGFYFLEHFRCILSNVHFPVFKNIFHGPFDCRTFKNSFILECLKASIAETLIISVIFNRLVNYFHGMSHIN